MIPPKLHFIWVGNSIPLGGAADNGQRAQLIQGWQSALQSMTSIITRWRRGLSAWQFHLWVEDRSIEDDARQGFQRNGVVVHNISELAPPRGSSDWYTFMCSELFGQRPNFGAASDILRLAILYQHGGVYTDFDNFPGQSISKLNDLVATQDLLVGLFPNPPVFCNAVLGAKAGSNFIRDYLNCVVDEYRAMYQGSWFSQGTNVTPATLNLVKSGLKAVKSDHTSSGAFIQVLRDYNVTFHQTVDKMGSTLMLSGPIALRWVICKHFGSRFQAQIGYGFNAGVSYSRYIAEGYDMVAAAVQPTSVREIAIPPETIRITSENSWSGAAGNVDQAESALVSDIQRVVMEHLLRRRANRSAS
jgi:hypothetical protein